MISNLEVLAVLGPVAAVLVGLGIGFKLGRGVGEVRAMEALKFAKSYGAAKEYGNASPAQPVSPFPPSNPQNTKAFHQQIAQAAHQQKMMEAKALQYEHEQKLKFYEAMRQFEKEFATKPTK